MHVHLSDDDLALLRAIVGPDDRPWDNRDKLKALIARIETAVDVHVVEVELPYSDYDGHDQDTLAYHWSTTVSSRARADAMVAALRAELDRTTTFSDAYCWTYRPSETREADDLTEAEAVASLRNDMVAHQSDPLPYDKDYWRKAGFTAEERTALFDDDLLDAGPFEGADYEEDLAVTLDEYIAAHPRWADDVTEFCPVDGAALLAKLRRWVAGEDLHTHREDADAAA